MEVFYYFLQVTYLVFVFLKLSNKSLNLVDLVRLSGVVSPSTGGACSVVSLPGCDNILVSVP